MRGPPSRRLAKSLDSARMIPHMPAPTTRSVDPGVVGRALLIRPRFLGDICLTLPALDAVRAACPAARIAYLTERESAPLIEGDPRVDELIVVSRSPGPRENLTLIRRLRRFAPDAAFDFFCNPRTALWTALSGARVRVGYPNKGWRSALYTHHARPRTLSAGGLHPAPPPPPGGPGPARVPRRPTRGAARGEG